MNKQNDITPRPSYWHNTVHSMTRRNVNIDYHRGRTAYMITLKIEEGKQLLASLPKIDAATSRSIRVGTIGTATSRSILDGTMCTATRSIRVGTIGTATSRSIKTNAMEPVRPILTSLGEAMRQAWLTLPERFPEVTIHDRADEWVIMPEHFHGILFVTENMLEHLSDIEKLFKQRVMMSYRQLLIEGAADPVGYAREWLAAYCALPTDKQVATAAWIERQLDNLYSTTSRRIEDRPPFKVADTGSHGKQGFLFAPSYNDKPFWDDETLAKKQHYILNNAINRIIRNGNPNWLKPIRGGVDTSLGMEPLKGYLRKECRPWQATTAILEGIERRLLFSATSRRIVDCDTYGNRELLDCKQHRLLPLVCHRADKPLRSKQREAFLAEAKRGAIVVSACVNPDENVLFKELVEAGYPVIKIEDNGFPEVYHPSEECQRLCGEGRYLIVTPWKYTYRLQDATLEVAFCKTMNCVAQAICRIRDDWWK